MLENSFFLLPCLLSVPIAKLNYIHKSTLDYKVNESKLHFKKPATSNSRRIPACNKSIEASRTLFLNCINVVTLCVMPATRANLKLSSLTKQKSNHYK